MSQAVEQLSIGLYRRRSEAAKRLFDIVVAGLALIALLPLLAVVTALIWIENPGNPFYIQERMGLYRKRFRMYKFRTMVPDAHARQAELAHLNEAQAPLFKMRRDPRVTRVGRILRTTSIDELPQLLNVLGGEMSLVGPRPPLPHEVDHYSAWESQRLNVTPGLTGLWQISGRSERTFNDMVSLDLEYIAHRSFWLDLRLIVATFWVVAIGRGAY